MWFIFLLIAGIFTLILCCGCCITITFAFIQRRSKEEEDEERDYDETIELVKNTKLFSHNIYIK